MRCTMVKNPLRRFYKLLENKINQQIELGFIDEAIEECNNALSDLKNINIKDSELRDKAFAFFNLSLSRAYIQKASLIEAKEEFDKMLSQATICLDRSEKIYCKLQDNYNKAIIKVQKATIVFLLSRDYETIVREYLEACDMLRDIKNEVSQVLYTKILRDVVRFCIEGEIYNKDFLTVDELEKILAHVIERAKILKFDFKSHLLIEKIRLKLQLKSQFLDYEDKKRCRCILQKLKAILKKELDCQQNDGNNPLIHSYLVDTYLSLARIESGLGENYLAKNKKNLAKGHFKQAIIYNQFAHDIIVNNQMKIRGALIIAFEIDALYNSLYNCTNDINYFKEAFISLFKMFEIFKTENHPEALWALLLQKIAIYYAYFGDDKNAINFLIKAECNIYHLPNNQQRYDAFIMLYKNYSKVFQLLGEKIIAVEYLHKARDLLEGVNDVVAVRNIDNEIINIINRSFISEETNQILYWLYKGYASSCIKQGRPNEAIEYLTKMKNILLELGYGINEAEVLEIDSEIHKIEA